MPIKWKTNSIKRSDNQKMVIKYLKEQKSLNPNYKVIDLGGAHNPWADEVVDAYIDISSCKEGINIENKIIIGDLLKEDTWDKIAHEHYDFCICTHILEDVRCPDFIINKINKYFDEGYISMPNKHTELSFVDYDDYIGYHHHRWIFTIHNDKLRALAKMPGLGMFCETQGKVSGLVNRIKFIFGDQRYLNLKKTIAIDWVDTAVNKKDNDLAFLFRGGFMFEYINNDSSGNGFEELKDLYRISLKDGL